MRSKPGVSRPATHSHDKPLWVSISRLSQCLVCPLSYWFRYTDNVIVSPSPKAFVGRAVRAALLEYYRQRLRRNAVSAGDLGHWLQTYWAEAAVHQGVHFTSALEEKALQRLAFFLVVAYLREVGPNEPFPLTVDSLLRTPLIDPESGEDHGVVLAGNIDLVLAGHEGPWLINLKVSSRRPPQLEILHEIQLAAHSFLYRHVPGQIEAGLEVRTLMSTKTPQVQFQRFAARSVIHFRRLLTAVTAFRDALRFNNECYFRPTWMCTWCDYRDNLCPSWTPES